LEGEKREIVRDAQQKQHELQVRTDYALSRYMLIPQAFFLYFFSSSSVFSLLFNTSQSENEELRSENKRLENDKMMEQKDHDTERTLLKSHISNLEKQLKDREMVLRDCQESKEAELQEAKTKLQGMKAEDEAKLNKEREDSRQKLEEMKVKYEEKIREFKEEINVKQTVFTIRVHEPYNCIFLTFHEYFTGSESAGREDRRSEALRAACEFCAVRRESPDA
jgi:hypothetical protein